MTGCFGNHKEDRQKENATLLDDDTELRCVECGKPLNGVDQLYCLQCTVSEDE